MREELDAEEILISLSEPVAKKWRPEGPGTAEFDPSEHSCVFGTEESSSEEVGIRSGQVIIEDLDGSTVKEPEL